MDNPFFGRCWGRVPESRSYQRPHYNHPNPHATPPVKSEKAKPKKFVTINVNFVESDTARSRKPSTMDESTAAVKIQGAFRGFCVRKTRTLKKLRVIMKTKAEAAEIGRRVNDEQFVELIRGDEKERLKIAEWIMSLLLRLDEIQGVIPFVRESRKAVIRDLINLQETVDHTSASKCRQDFKRKELPGGVIEISASNKKAEESKMQDLQIEGYPEEENNSSLGLGNFEQGSSQNPKFVSGSEEYTIVDFVDKDPEKAKAIEDLIGTVREDNEKIKRTVSDLLKKSEKQSEMIHDLSVRISQLEEHISQCNT